MEVTDIDEIDWTKLIEEKTEVGGFRKTTSDRFYASQLIFCRQKKRFSDDGLEPVEVKDNSWRGRQIGTLIHSGMENILLKEGYKIEQKKTKKIGDYTISGRVDAINDEHIVEIKYKSWYKGVSTWEAVQLGVYLNLFDRPFGYLVYISQGTITSHKHTHPIPDETILGYIRSTASPVFDWECKYCGYKGICSIARRIL